MDRNHRTRGELEERLSYIRAAPADEGELKMIVIRPEENGREILESCELSLARGAHGDSWEAGCWKKLPDGKSDPVVQLAITNYRVLEVLADDDEHRALAGDNLYVDLDLGDENLKAGDRLEIGDEVVLEITAEPHNGCRKFKGRFGTDALAFVNSPEGKELHLRGIYAFVVRDGTVRVGDGVRKGN